MDLSKEDEATNEAKRGRKKKESFLEFRTSIWYWCVRAKSQLSDGKLDLLVVPKHPSGEVREYIDRIRIFETLRRTKASISNGEHAKRSYKLLELVEELPMLEGSQALYESPFWEYVLKPFPTLPVVREELIRMINHLELYTINRYKDLRTTTEYERIILAEILTEGYKHYTDGSKKYTSTDIDDLLGGEIKTDKRGGYDDLLHTFANIRTFDPLVEESLDLKLLTKYFDFLHFSIVYYQYSMLTANLHAVIAASEWIKQLLSLLSKSKIISLDQKLTKDLGKETYALIFDAKTLSKKDVNTIFSEITGEFDRDDQGLPIVKFVHAL